MSHDRQDIKENLSGSHKRSSYMIGAECVPARTDISFGRSCILCAKSNNLANSIQGRKNGLYFGCMEQGHKSKGCLQRKICQSFLKPHTSSLHGDVINFSKQLRVKQNLIAYLLLRVLVLVI